MGDDENASPDAEENPAGPVPTGTADPPYQAVAPNLDRLSRDSLKPGSVSRTRIGRATLGLLVVLAVVAGIVVWTLVA